MSRFPSVPLTTGVPFFAVVSFNKGALARKGQIVILGIAGETRPGCFFCCGPFLLVPRVIGF